MSVTFTLPAALADSASALLWDQGVLGVTQTDDETRARPDEPQVPTGLATLCGTFLEKRGLQTLVVRKLAPVLGAAQRLGVTVELAWAPVPQANWNNVWMDQWKPLKVSQHLWVVPSWEKDAFVLPAGDLALHMDPGMAFGTGTHETTQLCTAALEDLMGAQDSKVTKVLDVGTGSGILAMAAVHWARQNGYPLERVLGVDIDPDSVTVARANAALNGLDLTVENTPVEKVTGTFDVVVANILLAPLLEMKHHLLRLTAPRGVLVMSGILETQRGQLEAAFAAVGLRTVARQVLGDWACVQCQRAAPSPR